MPTELCLLLNSRSLPPFRVMRRSGTEVSTKLRMLRKLNAEARVDSDANVPLTISVTISFGSAPEGH